MKLKYGKCYWNRIEEQTEPLVPSGDEDYPFRDPRTNMTFTEEGYWNVGHENKMDLVQKVPTDDLSPSQIID